jgi:transposase
MSPWMPVYPVAVSDASCATPGCRCRDRVARYPSDLTDAQWEAVHAFFQRWSQRGLPQRLVDRLRHRLRVRARRDAQPSAAIVDSQSVKTADTVGAGSRGFDNGKKINRRKRHLAVDVEGFLLAVVVTAAHRRVTLLPLCDPCHLSSCQQSGRCPAQLTGSKRIDRSNT